MRAQRTELRDDRLRGVNLLEISITIAVFSLLVLASMANLLTSHRLAVETDLERLARQAAQSELERLQSLPFPTLAQHAQGRRFFVTGLPPRSGEIAEHGLVTVYLQEDDPESPAQPAGAVGFDLDGNGQSTDTLTTSSRYRLLPVRIDIRWEDAQQRARAFQLAAVISSPTDFMRQEG